MRRLREEIAGLWRTDPVRQHRPEPLDEVRATLALFDQTIFTTLPLVYREVDRALDPDRSGVARARVRAFLRWGTWVGGDRDGNPSVTAETTAAATAIATDHVLRGLENAARRIARSLSVSDRDVPPSPALRRALVRDERTLPGPARGSSPESCPTPPIGGSSASPPIVSPRRAARTRRPTTTRRSSSPISTCCSGRSTPAAHPTLAWGELQHLRWQAETFGFHLAEMEVRQHADVFDAALARARPGRGRRRPRARPAREAGDGRRRPGGDERPRPARCSRRSARSATCRIGSGRPRATG